MRGIASGSVVQEHKSHSGPVGYVQTINPLDVQFGDRSGRYYLPILGKIGGCGTDVSMFIGPLSAIFNTVKWQCYWDNSGRKNT